MIRFFIEGNIIYMGILSLLFLFIIGLAVYAAIIVYGSESGREEKVHGLIGYIKSIALFTLVFSILSQIIGLVDVFQYESQQEVGTAARALAQALKLTFHPTIFGIIIYLLSIVFTVGLNLISGMKK